MTDKQRKKMRILRYQGFGYKKIGLIVGLSRDIIRGYCKRNGLDGYGTELVKEYKKVMEEEFVYILCLNCGVEIEQNKIGARKKYCSVKCKREWDNNHRKEYELNCEYCGKKFKALGNKNRKFCNHDCYTRDRFWREEDALKVANKIIEFKKVNNLPKWLKDLLLSKNGE